MSSRRITSAVSGVLLGAIILVALAGAPALALAQTGSTPATAKSLYHRLGGFDALAAVTDDFIGRLASDPDLAPFFKGHSSDSLKRVRQNIVDQLCALTGGPCYYTGRDMKTAHAGMGITQAQWDKSVTHLVATLDAFKVPQKEMDEVLSAVGKTHDDIVEKK